MQFEPKPNCVISFSCSQKLMKVDFQHQLIDLQLFELVYEGDAKQDGKRLKKVQDKRKIGINIDIYEESSAVTIKEEQNAHHGN